MKNYKIKEGDTILCSDLSAYKILEILSSRQSSMKNYNYMEIKVKWVSGRNGSLLAFKNNDKSLFKPVATAA